VLVHKSMETRQKVPLGLITDCLTFKQSIKASSSEIIKDLVQINESAVQIRKKTNEVEFKKPKSFKTFCVRKTKLSITEDVGAILGLATLMNEMNDPATSSVSTTRSESIEQEKEQEKEKEEERLIKIPKNKKTVKANKQSLSKFTRAGTHVALAFLIKQKKDKTKVLRSS